MLGSLLGGGGLGGCLGGGLAGVGVAEFGGLYYGDCLIRGDVLGGYVAHLWGFFMRVGDFYVIRGSGCVVVCVVLFQMVFFGIFFCLLLECLDGEKEEEEEEVLILKK